MRSAWLDEEKECGELVRHSALWSLNEPTQPRAPSRTGLWLEANSGVSLRTLTSLEVQIQGREERSPRNMQLAPAQGSHSGCSNTKPSYLTLNSLLG